jgi:hypothetical protein
VNGEGGGEAGDSERSALADGGASNKMSATDEPTNQDRRNKSKYKAIRTSKMSIRRVPENGCVMMIWLSRKREREARRAWVISRGYQSGAEQDRAGR